MADRAQTCSTARVRCPAQGGAAGGMSESADTDGSVWQEAAREDNPSLARTLTWRISVDKSVMRRKAMVSRRLFLQSAAAAAIAAASAVPAARAANAPGVT